MNYHELLKSKIVAHQGNGFEVHQHEVNQILFPFQRDIVIWALRLGSAAVFADCGLGKTFMLLEWARLVNAKVDKPVLIGSPLGVTGQTIQEAGKLGTDVFYARAQSDLSGTERIVITNYEMLDKFRADYFGGIVIDESSILKNFTGKTKQLILKMGQKIPYRLALTATPAPNDHLELGNHAEFLGIMRSREMIQRWFVNDTMKAGGYRLREHGAADFWRWVSSWAVSLQKPNDIGDYDNTGYILPDLNFTGHIVPVDHARAWNEVDSHGQFSLLLVGNTSATGMHKEKRQTLEDRMRVAADTVRDIQTRKPQEYIIVWCEYNYEADILRELLPDAIELRGSEKLEVKQQKLLDFSNGKFQVLITKPKIAAHGLNWQHAGEQVWTSINHKFEQFYQGYKRSHRFGRHDAVNCHIVYAESEGSILSNLERKHREHELMQREMINAMRENGMSVRADRPLVLVGEYGEFESGPNWKLYHGDSAVTLQQEQSESVDFIVQSPPFKSLYIYSSNVEDLGNCVSDSQFYEQYQYILKEELRIAKPGAYKCEHCKDLPLYQNRDGEMGLQDFPGELITAHLEAGWEFVDWITVWKDPVIEMQRTKNAGLLWSSAFCERAERARQGMADYTLVFRKPGGKDELDATRWLPLPKSVIARCIDLWTNPGENVQVDGVGNGGLIDLLVLTAIPSTEDIAEINPYIRPGRNIVVNVHDPVAMTQLIIDMKKHRLVFHSRVALTNGSWLVVFRKWVGEMDAEHNPDIAHVLHSLVASTHSFVVNSGPEFWQDDRHYSIQVWQRYASPVWFDLDGLPATHHNIWFDIDQTNVLNHRIAREEKDEKHICPLQLDLIEKCILRYTKPGQRVHTSFAGVGSELVTAIRLGREARGSELKRSYYELAIKHLRQETTRIAMPSLFDFAKIGMPEKLDSDMQPTAR